MVPLGTDSNCVVYKSCINILGGAVQTVEMFIYANIPVLRYTILGKTFSLV